MDLTALIKVELSRLKVRIPSIRKAEASTMLRFAGSLHHKSGRWVVQVEVGMASVADRLRSVIAEIYGHRSEIRGIDGGRAQTEGFVVSIEQGGEALAHQIGLLDSRGNPVRGLPPTLVNGSVPDLEGVWRGAFLAKGSITGPTRSPSLAVTCPSPETALAMVGVARRLGIEARTRETSGVERVFIRSDQDIAAMLRHMGALKGSDRWENQRIRVTRDGVARRSPDGLDNANQRRALQTAMVVGARVERALEILGDKTPEHLRYAGQLRLIHKEASLEELGRLADPPLSKDTIASRIRRLLATADRRAAELHIPNTEGPQLGLMPSQSD